MKTVRISQSEFDLLKQMQIKYRMDWPASFSTNERGDLWLFAGRSYTHPGERIHVRRDVPVLDQIADIYISLREGGGRFFVDENGVYWKEKQIQYTKFIQWIFD